VLFLRVEVTSSVKNTGFSVHKKCMDLQIQKHHSRVDPGLD
jgi:hypothetical protein